MTQEEIEQQKLDIEQLRKLKTVIKNNEMFKMSVEMKQYISTVIGNEIAELEYHLNGPSEAELEFEQSLLD